MERIHIYTEKYYLLPRFKHVIKYLLGRSFRGPQAVEKSLADGLTELNQVFDFNQPPRSFGTIGVLSGVRTLRNAIKWKEQGKIKRILAGPNVVVTPQDYNNLIQNPLIDIILLPSQWCVDFFASLAPNIASKLRVWPAGVDLPKKSAVKKSIDFLVYNKVGQSELFFGIIEYLKKNNLSFKVLEYGDFKQSEYFSALEKSKALIYLSESETQGLGMLEAWARGVPTLVWERGFWKNGKYFWSGNTASPYVNKKNGAVFKDIYQFIETIQSLNLLDFSPRQDVEENFTNAVSAKKYLKLLEMD